MQEKRRKKWAWVCLGAAAAAAAVAWAGFLGASEGKGSTGYKTAAVERGEIVQAVTANGALRAVQTVQVGSEVSGKIVELYADYNTAVTNGQVLAKLDASTYERQLEQAEAELESARASLKLAEANHRRAKELRERELVSQADYDQAEASLAQARASLRMREASLSKVEVDLEKTTIFSPMDGVVISRAVDVGQTVAASLNAPTLFTLAKDLRKMRIEALVSEADVGGVAEGQEATFTVDAHPARTFTGTVSQVRYEPVTAQNVVNYVAIVDVDNGELLLRPGMTANASVTTAKRTGALRLPNAALRFRPEEGEAEEERGRFGPPPEMGPGTGGPPPEGMGPPPGAMERARKGRREGGGAGGGEEGARRAYVLGADGKLRAARVRTGITDGSWTEVTEGLREGDLVATGRVTAEEKAKAAAGGSPFMPGPQRRSWR